ncbi:MAG: UDP-N-acetylmuramoyl-L-alanyl-D-glutamate--2,6-diaminopimelate ligase, partial [Parasporobacterium sp.]|nr:UDP-N-acetylmuramoyl-L-alanyl-D-glutamate--2,6-diaminopimelate ligase [Parasporobacterium sp.]
YIESAINNGASRIVCREGSFSVPTVNVLDPRQWLEEALHEEYGSLIDEMTLIGVTGTNGKTTVCYLIYQALNALGRPCGYIGTIGFYLDGKVRSLPNTSVDICDLYELLIEAHEKGFDTVALEASSQGLAMGRLHTITFDIAVFTNLTEDHLDYHINMENYALAKQELFRRMKKNGKVLLNADDPARDYFDLPENDTYFYGFSGEGIFHCNEKVCSLVMPLLSISDYSFEGTPTFSCILDGEKYTGTCSLFGKYNLYNLSACMGVLKLLGVEDKKIFEVLPSLETPDGRFKKLDTGTNSIIIDYAHTPDAVEKIIGCAHEMKAAHVYVVFGCTGDREREKRPVMTKLVLSNADYAIITDDDPHFEPEEQIFADMLEGNVYTNYEICADRREAIKKG